MVRPMVHSTKHYVQQSIGTSVVGTNTDTIVVSATDVAQKDLVNEVEEGNSVKAIYFEMWLRSAATSASSFTFIIEKRIAGLAAPSAGEMAALGDYNNKKNIFYTSQGLVNDVDSTALSVIRGWVKIPKSKQRMGLGDTINWNLNAIGQSINFCGFQIYKEYS